MFHNLDQLWLQLERENLLEVNPRTCLEALRTQFKEFFASKRVNSSEHLNQCWQKHFKEYTFCEPNTYRRDLLENLDTLEAVIHRALQQHESLVTESTTLEANLSMDINALDVGLAVIESNKTNSYKQDTSSSSGTYITHVMDADIRPVNDQVSSPEVDSNTTSDSTNMSHRGREIDQDSEQDQVKSPLLKAEFLKMNDMVKKEVYNELSNRFLQLEKQCISLEISMQQKKESFQRHRFSPKKTSAVYEKTSPRSFLRWKSTGKIFTTIGLKWIPTGKLFDSCTSKVDSEPPNGSNDAITNPYECDQTLNVSACTLNLIV
ncbi:hypothetical protein Tco_0699467, partial [Tanacetum coccineum]